MGAVHPHLASWQASLRLSVVGGGRSKTRAHMHAAAPGHPLALLLLLLPPQRSADGGWPTLRQAGGSPPPPVWVQTNPLKDLAPLPKVHHSWGLPSRYLNTSDPAYIDGLLHDYVRITGSCSIPLVADGYVEVMARSCVAICEATAAARKAAGLPRAVISALYSPWERIGSDPTVTGAAEQAELAAYRQLLTGLHKWVGGDPAVVGAVLLDQEAFSLVCPGNSGCDALTRKNDLIFNLTRSIFPGVRIEMYDRGAVSSTDRWDHFCGEATGCSVPDAYDRPYHYTLQELGSSFGASLYQLPEIWHQRTLFRQTVAAAQRHNTSGQTMSVTPWLSLGAGYRRNANFTKPHLVEYEYSMAWDYERVYSWQVRAKSLRAAFVQTFGGRFF